MKRFFKLFLLALCLFVTNVNVYAAGNYKYYGKTYCYTTNGTFGKKVNAADTTCSGYYGGTVYKQIDGQDAYCNQKNASLPTGTTCTLASYNQFSWMNGNWNEANAIKLGYGIQYIKSKKYSHEKEYVYIVNMANQMLQFRDSAPVRTLHSDIQAAINYANTMYNQLSKSRKISGNPISVGFVTDTLTNVGESYSKGEVNLAVNNPSALSTMDIAVSCNNCKLYTDSTFSKEFTGATVKASQSLNTKLYVKTNSLLDANSKVTVTVKGTFSDISYPIASVWNCSGKQSLSTLSTAKAQISATSVSTSAVVPQVKRICKIYNGQYYGKNGTVVTEQQYRDECLNICKVVDGKYYGKDGKEVNYETYKNDCLNICKVVDGKYYGKDGKVVSYETYKNDCLNICKVVDGKYYGKDGKEVEYSVYKEECLKICKFENGKYYGMNGTEVTKSVYESECVPSEIIVPPTGSNSSAVPVVLGSILVVAGLGSIKLSKKKNNM